MIRSLNFKQREVFDFVIQWCIDLVKNSNLKKLVQMEAFTLPVVPCSGGGKLRGFIHMFELPGDGPYKKIKIK